MTELAIMFGADVNESCLRKLLDRGGTILVDIGRYLLIQRAQLVLYFLLDLGNVVEPPSAARKPSSQRNALAACRLNRPVASRRRWSSAAIRRRS